MRTGPQQTIPRRRDGGPAPLSFGQQRLWFLYQLDPDGAAFNLPEAVRLESALDVAALRFAFAALIRRHEPLRTVFAMAGGTGGEPVQIVTEDWDLPLPCADLSGLPAAARLPEAARLGPLLIARPFDLTRSLPLHATLLRLGPDDHALVLVLHHIASDGWSMGILVRELTALYGAFSAGRPSPLPELPIQYADFAAWQRDRLQGETLDALLRYWRERLAGAPTSLVLPSDRPRSAVQSSRGSSAAVALGPEATAALRELALARGSSLFMLLTAAFGVLLQRSTREDDFLVGAPVAGRGHWELEGLIGFFVNMLPLRLDHSGDPTFPELLDRVRDTLLGAEAHQELPFESLIKALDLPRDLSQTPLFQAVLAFQSLAAAQPPPSEGPPDDGPSPFGVEPRTALYDLHLVLNELPQRVSGLLIYRTDLFDASSAARLARSLETLLQGIAARSGRPVSELPLLTHEERRQLIAGWNRFDARFPRPEPLHRLFADTARRAPQAEALCCGEERWSYARLEAEADRLAQRLRRLGVGPEDRVGLCLERSPEMIAAILATLQAGAAYVPLDPDLPRERLAYLLEASGAAVLLTHSGLEDRLPEARGPARLRLDAEEEESPAPLPDVTVDPDQTAYVIYTSGSTGLPKGVAVTHGNVVRLLAAAQDLFAFGSGDVWTLFHSYAFDFSVWEIWGALAWGGRLVIVPYLVSRSPEDFLDLLETERVTVLNQTPSAFRQLAAAEAHRPHHLALRTVIFGGEALDPAALAPWLERHGDREPLLVNMYGITETTVHVTYRPISWADLGAGSRIGVPLPDLQVHVLDRRFEPAPLLAPGEIHVRGAGLARGYLSRPDLTAERFVPDPFSPEPGARLYRSGDLARRRPDGDLEYLGRIDHQVKIRGFRIELGEIQAALAAHPEVREAVVLSRGRDGADAGDTGRLVAWIVPRDGQPPGTLELRAWLERRLPAYMVPAAFVHLNRLPLTPNGKLDRKALPAPDPAAAREDAGEFIAPEPGAEAALARAWSETLGVPKVSALDNFFALGGDSILSLRVLSRMRELGWSLSLQQIFQYQTVRELAHELAREDGSGGHDQDAGEPSPFSLLTAEDRALLPQGLEDAYPVAQLQAGMLFHSELDPESAVYHDISSVHLQAPFDAGLLREAAERVTALHPLLRTSFELTGYSEPLQLVHREAALDFEIADLRHLDRAAQEEALAAWMDAEKTRPFDWRHAPLLRFRIDRRGEDTLQFILSFHHAILDGWSLSVLLADLMRIYLALIHGREAEEAPPPHSFLRFVALEREALGSAESRAYWSRQLAGLEATKLPRCGQVSGGRGSGVRLTDWPEDVSARLLAAARLLGVPAKSALLAVHARVLAAMSATSHSEVVTGLVTNGRPEEDRSDSALGLFLNTLPLRLATPGGTWNDLMLAAFAAERTMLPHRRYPLAQLLRESGGEPLFEPAFNFVHFHLHQGFAQYQEVRSLGSEFFDRTNFTFLANFSLDPFTSLLQLRIDYDPEEFPAVQIDAIAGYYDRALTALAEDPAGHYEDSPLLSAAESAQALQEGNDTVLPIALPPCIHQIFEVQADLTPEEPALEMDGDVWTYRELEERSNRLARLLRRRGVTVDDPVGICLERSLALPMAVLAALKAGGAYLPLDPAFPFERLTVMVEEAGLKVLLAGPSVLERLPAGWLPEGVQTVRLDPRADALEAGEPDRPERPEAGATANSLGYVLYTSGSTGRPKGVSMPHGALVNLIGWQLGGPRPERGLRTLQFTSLGFDPSFEEMFSTWGSGGTLVMITEDERRDPGVLLDFLIERRIERVFQPFVALQQLAEAARARGTFPAGLRDLATAGEQLQITPAVADLFRHVPGCRLFNQYGPTETHVTTAALLTGDPGSWPGLPSIGKPIANHRIYLLDPHGQPAPPDTPGDIFVAGAGLARGYLRRPDLTAERFVPDPFSGEPGARLYRTGDLARRLPDGDLELLGRADRQVKIRGHRVEPGEIETVLAGHPAVRECAVVVHGEGTTRRLAAFFVVATGAGTASSAAAEITAYLRERLPEYMVPSAFLAVEALPLTPSGKVDRGALARLAASSELPRPELGHAFVAPRNPTEEQLAHIWAEALQLERVGIHDDFLDVGGHSLVALQMMHRVRETLGVHLPLHTLFSVRTVANLAAAVAGAQAEAASAAPLAEAPVLLRDPFDPHLPAPLSAVQEAYWTGGSGLFDLGGSSANIFTEYEAAGAAAADIARRLGPVLARAVARHPMLRTVFSADGTQRVLPVPEIPPYEVEFADLSHLSESEAEHRLESTRERLCYARHRTDRWPLFDMAVFQLPGGRVRYQVRLDALLVDGTARAQLLGELIRGVLGESDPPAPAVTYLDYVRSLRAFRGSAAWERSRAYWHERLPSLPGPPRLPLARGFGPETVPRIVKRTLIVLPPDAWASLCRQAAGRGITPTGIGTAILAETLRSWSEEPAFTLGVTGTYCPPIHPEIRQVIGTFAHLTLLEVEAGAGSFAERARRLQDRLNSDLDHQHYSGHEVLRELNRLRRSGGRATLPIQFTSVLRAGAAVPHGTGQDTGLDQEPESREDGLREIDLRIAMPQVLILWVLAEGPDRSLALISQAVEELFLPGLINDLLDGYQRLAQRLAEDDAAWSEPRPLRPQEEPLPAALVSLSSGEGLKGVEAAARELVRLAGLSPGDSLFALSPPGSSLALCETLAASAAGATVVLPEPAEWEPGALAALAARERITVWSSSPAVFEAALHRMEQDSRLAPSSLRRVLLHRDRIPAGLAARLEALKGHIQDFATWGTEEAPLAASGPLSAAALSAAAAGRSLRVLDRDLMPRPTWVPGDLYWSAGDKLEPTGTRARRLPDGRIELLGNEPAPPVETLGYGADPRRIEEALQQHPAVRHAVVAWRGTERRLVAWLLLRSGQAPGDDELRDPLRLALPEHQIPSVFVRLEEFPLTPDGHVDRAALAAPPEAPRLAAWSRLEIELAGLWEEILGSRPVTPGDDFFELGGNSLLVTRLMRRVAERYGFEGPLASFLNWPTVSRLAELVVS